MRSPRRLYVLTAVALASVAAASVDLALPRGTRAALARLFPEFDADRVVAVRWSGGGEEELAIRREEGEFVITKPGTAPARDATVRAFLGAIEIAEADATPAPAVLDENFREVAVELEGGPALHFRVAPPTDADQRFSGHAVIEVAGRRSVIPGYLGRELALRHRDVRPRRPFASLASADVSGLVIAGPEHKVILEGPPWQVSVGGEMGRIYADPAVAAQIEQRMRALRFDEFRPSPADLDAARLFYLRARAGDWIEIAAVGHCGDDSSDYLVHSPIGTGCIERKALDELLALAAPSAIYDRHLVAPGRSADVEAAEIRRGRQALRIEREDADWVLRGASVANASAETVLGWLKRLDDLVVGEPRAANDLAVSEWATVHLDLAGGQPSQLSFLREGGAVPRLWVKRDDETALWPVATRALQVVQPTPAVFADLELVEFPAQQLVEIRKLNPEVIDGLRRGETLDEWEPLLSGRQIRDPGLGARLAQAVGHLYADWVRPVAGDSKVGGRVELEFLNPLAESGRSVRTFSVVRKTPCRLIPVGRPNEEYGVSPEVCDVLRTVWTH